MKKNTLLLSAFLCLGLGSLRAQVTDLFDFNDTTGAFSWGSVILSGNVLYGTTAYGGINEDGNIFSINTDGSGFKDLWDFDGGGDTNGDDPGIALTLSGHKLYGTTWDGGRNGYGNIYSINTNGSGYKDLWDFDGGGDTNGTNAECTLILLGNKLYGMTVYGGLNRDGNIFSIDTDGKGYKDLWDFDDTGSNGENPYGSLTLSSSGKALYGMTWEGGRNNNGLVFRIDTDGTHYKDLFDFNGNNGSNPGGDVTLSGKMIYGMTNEGGANYDNGVIFSIDTNGHNFKDLLFFDGLNGAYPEGSLTLSGNLLYGMTNAGGLYNYGGKAPTKGPSGDGVIFSIDTNGNGFTDIFNFNNTDGSNPEENLTLSGSTLYGMATIGGFYNDGLVFSDDLCNLLSTTQHVVADSGDCRGTASVTPAGGPSPFTYSWSNGQTAGTATGLCTGTYTCTITDKNGCAAATAVTVNYVTTGINEVKGESGEVKVYPNPSNGIFTIQLSVGSGQSSVIEVYNVLGEQVHTSTLPPPNGGGASSIFQMNLSSQPNGIYLYRVLTQTGNLVGQGKLIIQK